jgi:hypothetical protein
LQVFEYRGLLEVVAQCQYFRFNIVVLRDDLHNNLLWSRVGVKVEPAFTWFGLRQLRSPLGGLQHSPSGVEFAFAADAEDARSMAGISALPGSQDVG